MANWYKVGTRIFNLDELLKVTFDPANLTIRFWDNKNVQQPTVYAGQSAYDEAESQITLKTTGLAIETVISGVETLNVGGEGAIAFGITFAEVPEIFGSYADATPPPGKLTDSLNFYDVNETGALVTGEGDARFNWIARGKVALA